MFWIKSYIVCELTANRHGEQFVDLCKDIGIINDIDYLKVIKYAGNISEVYYVSEKVGDFIIYIKKKDNIW